MTQVYVDNDNHYIRGKLYEESQIPKGQKYWINILRNLIDIYLCNLIIKLNISILLL